MRPTNVRIVILAASAFAALGTAQADITGNLWEAPKSGLVDGSSDSVPASAPASTPDVTFSVPNGPVGFDSRGIFGNATFYTIAAWLGTGGATITTGAGEGGNTINDCLVELKGLVSVVNGQTFSVVHDDGLTLSINGSLVVNVPGPTPPITTVVTYTGPTGTFAFDLLYAEADGPPAVLNVDLPFTPVPEPTTVIAGALLLLPFGFSAIRQFRSRRQAV